MVVNSNFARQKFWRLDVSFVFLIIQGLIFGYKNSENCAWSCWNGSQWAYVVNVAKTFMAICNLKNNLHFIVKKLCQVLLLRAELALVLKIFMSKIWLNRYRSKKVRNCLKVKLSLQNKMMDKETKTSWTPMRHVEITTYGVTIC